MTPMGFGMAQVDERKTALIEASNDIIIGTVIDTNSFWLKQEGIEAIYTITTLKVESVLKGSLKSEVLEFGYWGGTVNGTTIDCITSPFDVENLKIGHKYQIYSTQSESKTLPVKQVALFSEEIGNSSEEGVILGTPGVDWVHQYQRYQFEWMGTHIAPANMPMHFRVNPNTNDLTSEETLVSNGFATWENDAYSTVDFSCDGTTPIETIDTYDGTNACFWKLQQWFTEQGYGQALAMTVLRISIGCVIQWDMAFNDGATSTTVNWCNGAISGKYDVQSHATHEAGHVCGLEDLYCLQLDAYQTMYGFASTYTIDPRSLETGDKDGIRWIYPHSTYIAPIVDITEPTGGYISGPVTIRATISVPYGTLSNVKFKATTFSSDSYDMAWTTMTLSGGQYTYTWTPPAGSGVAYYLSVRAELTNGLHGFDWVQVIRS